MKIEDAHRGFGPGPGNSPKTIIRKTRDQDESKATEAPGLSLRNIRVY